MAYRNAKSILGTLNALVDHAPNTVETRDSRLDACNDYYLDTSRDHDWIFLEDEVDYKVWADRTAESTGFTADVTNGTHLVTFSGSLTDEFIAANNGQPFRGTPTGTQYLINRFISTTEALLNNAWADTTKTLDDWIIPCRHFYLPVDCSRALRFIDRENGIGPLVILDRRKEEDWFSWQNDTTGTQYWMVDDTAEYDRPPDPTLAVAASTAAGTLTASATYEYCYTFTLQGRESPPSVPVMVTMGSSGATHQAVLTGIESTVDLVTATVTGIYKNVYRRQITSSATTNVYGRWLFLATLDEATVTLTDDGSPAPSLLSSEALVYQNGRKWMRPKWNPGEDATLRLRYLRYPRRLVSDSDAPMWPEAYHDMIAYGAAVNLAIQYGMTNKIPILEKRVKQMLDAMKGSHLMVPGVPTRREMMNMGDYGRVGWNCGRAVGNFTG